MTCTLNMGVDLMKYLQGWIGVVGFVALGNTISCYRGHQFLADKLYTGQPELVNPLVAHMFGAWTLMAGLVRIMCALDFRNKRLYLLTLVSFVVALLHYLSETFVYHTTTLTVGAWSPLIIASLSIVFMSVGWFYLDPCTEVTEVKTANFRRQKIFLNKKLS